MTSVSPGSAQMQDILSKLEHFVLVYGCLSDQYLYSDKAAYIGTLENEHRAMRDLIKAHKPSAHLSVCDSQKCRCRLEAFNAVLASLTIQ